MASAMRQLHLRNLPTMPLPALRNLSLFHCASPLKHLPILEIPRRASTRRYSSTASPHSGQQLHTEIHRLWAATASRTVALLSYFSGTESQEIPDSARRGTGFFVAPTLIVTSARVVGLVSTVFDSDRSSVLHNCFLAKTIAYNGDCIYQEVVCTRPVAVNFAANVAVLEVRNPNRLPPLAVANSVADLDTVLLGIARHGNCQAHTVILPMYHRTAREKSHRPKAPWPLDDKLEWIDYGAIENKDNVNVSLSDISGSPWFNLQREVVGMASWEAEKADGCISSYAAPPPSIKLMLDYAKTKGPHDPIVVDRWINDHTIPEYNSDITEECVPRWTTNVLVKMHKL